MKDIIDDNTYLKMLELQKKLNKQLMICFKENMEYGIW